MIRHMPGIRWILESRQVMDWYLAGKPGPAPHCVKQGNLRRCAADYSATVLVETGTFRADMVCALRTRFKRIISIELDETLHKYCVNRCKEFENVELFQGDSEQVLGEICPTLSGRVLFWLDGHYSGGDTAMGNVVCPVIAELNAIHRNERIEPIVVIDDARLFTGVGGYPTLTEVKQLLQASELGVQVSVFDDAIFVLPC